ncbi:uncharacterized protein PG986_012264 [Apiospora aurea]|uniref:Uncharacterized protein n=1 Tax=Apiospora aurea TaxID=335848 RepID=A0ABR1PZH4_9PEZI
MLTVRDSADGIDGSVRNVTNCTDGPIGNTADSSDSSISHIADGPYGAVGHTYSCRSLWHRGREAESDQRREDEEGEAMHIQQANTEL